MVPTIGRWAWLEELFESIEASSLSVARAVIANQSGAAVPQSIKRLENVEIIESRGGASIGRNEGLRALGDDFAFIALPNDHSRFLPNTLSHVARYFSAMDPPGALAGTLLEPDGPRFLLPKAGSMLNWFTVWRAIEPAIFISPAVGELRFNEGIGAGSASPWQAGEGADLLMRAMAEGHHVVAAPDVIVLGQGERRSLSPEEQQVKLRSYSRGAGYVMRLNHAGALPSTVHALSPLWRLIVPPPTRIRPSVRTTALSIVGRVEGRLGRCLPNALTRLSLDALRK